MPPWHSLAERKIWVIGGAGHLGSAITRALDEAGAKTLCVDRDDRAAALVGQEGLARTVPASCDIGRIDLLPGFIDRMAAEHGVPDGLVNLTVVSSTGKPTGELTAEDFQRTLGGALIPVFLLARSLAERMKIRGNGSIVLYASMYGVVAPDSRIYRPPLAPNPIDYGASKAALLQMARYLAMEYGPAGIRVNCVTPGPFPRPQVQAEHPSFIADLGGKTMLRRIGSSHEVVGPTLFLLGDGASYVTGHSLVVDGGWTAW